MRGWFALCLIRCFQVVAELYKGWIEDAIATSPIVFLQRMLKRWLLLVNVNIVSEGWSLRIDFDLFEGEEGAHGGDPRLPAGDGGGQGGQAPAGQVKQGKN